MAGPVCPKCLQLGQAHGVTRSVMRFMKKYLLAKLLSARLFGGRPAVEEVMAEIKGSYVYETDSKNYDTLMKLDNTKLQQVVRLGWCSSSLDPSESCDSFVAAVVKPALRVNCFGVSDGLADVIGRCTALICSGQAPESDIASLKLAAAAMRGRLQEHPLLQGLVLQTFRLLDKQQRGITTMAGRRSNETETESALIRDAGQTLAIACCNPGLARQFGVSLASASTCLDQLLSNSIPAPALALLWPKILEENFLLVDQRYHRVKPNAKCYPAYVIMRTVWIHHDQSFCSAPMCKPFIL